MVLAGNTRQDAGSLALRGFAYQALSQLGERIPSVLSQDLEIPERLFEMLAVEAPGVRASLQQSLATLSAAYAGVEGDRTHSLDTVLPDLQQNTPFVILCTSCMPTPPTIQSPSCGPWLFLSLEFQSACIT